MANYQDSSTSNNIHNQIATSLSKAIDSYYSKVSSILEYNRKVVTVCFSTHRVEIVNLLAPIMDLHNIIVLEEPSSEEFYLYINGQISLDDYLEFSDFTFPLFQRELYKKILEIVERKSGSVLQIDPYLNILIDIHKIFSAGGDTSDLPTDLHRKVYEAEKRTTGVLLRYYQLIMKGSFDDILDKIVKFAMEDAARIRLRDSMRAEKVAKIVNEKCELEAFTRFFVESGYIHLWFFKQLKKLLHNRVVLFPFFPASPVISCMHELRKKHVYTPGDILTLHFVFNKPCRNAHLLAARSLIFSKILSKDEMLPSVTLPYPHTRNELECVRLVTSLSIGDCKRLFGRLRFARSREAREIVENYVKQELHG